MFSPGAGGYRSQMCSYGPDCRRGICFFAHQPPELRVVDQSYLQEIERQLDAMGVSSAAFGFPPSNNAKVQHHQERGTPGGSSNTTGASSTAAGSERSERES
ncbi:C3H1-type domain-containing protein [Haematococcus lacustris]|uniref:C3H1-type domain-containing protein n=1 Tax=Haematococcus lacustris TaxID=44745 RepID=A0A699ZQZ6_HAELA|nr:C3H1-type domain-containing protein [Haematococcus lacustris]